MSERELHHEYLAAVRAGDRRRAFQVVDALVQRGCTLQTLYLQVFQPTLRDIGQLWERDELTVAQEHLATAITQTAMARLYARFFDACPAPSGPRLVAACPEGERHEIGLRMVCDLLECEGWDTDFVGASVPLESFVALVRERRPEAVALSASISPHVPALAATVAALREAHLPRMPLILVGGRPFLDDPALAAAVGADATARDAEEAARLLAERFDRATSCDPGEDRG